MGYYIYHYKLTLIKPEDETGTALSEIIVDTTDLKLFEPFLQIVQTEIYVDSIRIYNTHNDLNSEKDRLKSSRCFLKRDTTKIDAYVQKKKYDKLFAKKIDTPYGVEVSFYDIKLVDGFYTETIFEHPFKDCNQDFFTKYKPGIYYSDLHAFHDACNLEYDSYRYPDKMDFNNLEELFRKNLIENFKYGESLLFFC